MPGFLYFIPKLDERFNPETCRKPFRDERLHVIFRDASITQANPIAGPEGIRGAIFAATNDHYPATMVKFENAKQVWRKCGDTHWLGYWKETPPSPEDLKRPKTISGERVTIAGQEWIIPLTGPRGINLPSAFDFGDDGKWNPVEDEEYRDLMKLSEEMMDALGDSEYDAVKQMELSLQFCADLLSVNYRVSNREVGMLRLLKTETVRDILQKALGLELVEREKKESGTAPTISEAAPGVAVS